MPRRVSSASQFFALILSSIALCAQQGASKEAEDKYLYLEEVASPRAMAWVKEENARTAKVLEADPRFAQYEAEALKIVEDPNRLSVPRKLSGEIYNQWQDAQHVQGILRKTTLADYMTPAPHWQTVIDYDALSAKDGTTWVPLALNCLPPENRHCLVRLSAGGEDAETLREFDLKTGEFVPNGFVLPRSKQDVTWKDADTLYVGRDWGAGTMTKSGYPYIAKEWKRGTPLESAIEIYRGKESDIGAGVERRIDAQGDTITFSQRYLDFFSSEFNVLTPGGFKRAALPPKCDVWTVLAGRLLVTVEEDWKPAGQTTVFRQGSLLAINLKEMLADPAHLKPAVVFAPTQEEFLNSVATTKDRLLITTLDHVQGRAYVYTPTAVGWTHKRLPVPDNMSVEITDTSKDDESFFVTIDGFLTPDSLYLGNAASATLKLARSLSAQFDASNDVVEQLNATSKDGTRVPYFVVRPKALKYDSSNPAYLTAYGGFQVSNTPSYSATMGKLWLEHGGVFVLANIRGGGEFGPAWHEAGLKTHRQRIYDDFAAVGQDLIARGITSSKHLGISGASNGGLLMGVEMTQHPDLWGAVVIGVPLLDMLRFEKIAAGASWVGEYGSVTVPEEREFLASISPYNQLKPGVNYPVPLIQTTTKDDRVGPQHARKFAAKMEEFHEPFLYDEIVEGGHGAGANLKELARTEAEMFVYFTRQLTAP